MDRKSGCFRVKIKKSRQGRNYGIAEEEWKVKNTKWAQAQYLTELFLSC